MTPITRIIRWLGAAVGFGVALAGLSAVAVAILLFSRVADLPKVPVPLRRIIEIPQTEILAANGTPILQIGGRQYVTVDQISLSFIQAILAIEDHRFWDHHGVNKIRMLKAIWITLFTDAHPQGASTITQQLTKNLFFSFEKTLTRKFRELLVSLQIEAQFSKEEILEAYLNQIYFGPVAQGVETASRVLFGKPAAQLNLAEAAMLAGLPKSPSRYNPLRHLERAKARQRVVLDRMAAVGYISRKEADAAFETPLEFNQRTSGAHPGGYFVDWVLKTLEERYGAQVVYHGGLKVTTTLDPQLQYLAQAALQNGLEDLDKQMGLQPVSPSDGIKPPQGAIVAVQVNSGAVKAMVGGRDYGETEFNRAVENNRLPGSGFKPMLYYTAFDKLGLTPASVVIDQPVRIPVEGSPDWAPQNFQRDYQGPVILKKAFAHSINTVAAQLVAQIGPQAVIDTAERCGIQSPLAPVYSVALGTSGVSPLEMASAFATFASGGVHYQPFGIWRVEDPYGQVLEEHLISGTKALDAQIAYQVVDMMQGVIEQGSGRIIRQLGFSKTAAGKTGTTNNYNDAWFTGFTPTLSTSVWVGFDQPTVMRDAHGAGITGGRGAAPIWARFMIKATEGEPARPFVQPSGIRLYTCDPTSGRPVDQGDPNAVSVAIRESTGFDAFNRW